MIRRLTLNDAIFALIGVVMTVGFAAGMLHQARHMPYQNDELVNTSAAIRFFAHGDYTNDSPFGLRQTMRTFSPYVSSGIAATWPSAVGWKISKTLLGGRMGSLAATWVFLTALAIGTFSLLGMSLAQAFFAAELLWLPLTSVPLGFGFICNLGELQGALWLALGAVLLTKRPALGFLCFGISVWLGKFIYLPAAGAIGAVFVFRVANSRQRKFWLVAWAFSFFLPLLLWLALIAIEGGAGAAADWLKQFPGFILAAHHGVDSPVLNLSLWDRLKLPTMTFGDGIWFWALLAVPSILGAAGFRARRRGGGQPPELWLFYALVPVIWLYYFWFLFVSPIMWPRHILPAIYLSIFSSSSIVAWNLIRHRANRRVVRGAACGAACVALISSASAWSALHETPESLTDSRTFPDFVSAGRSLQELEMFRNLSGHLKDATAPLSEGAHAVFAPTNAAFFGLAAPLMLKFQMNENEIWTRIFRHQVAAISFSPAELKDGQRIPLLDGSSAEIRFHDGGYFVDGIPIARAFSTGSGYIYAVDGLRMPL